MSKILIADDDPDVLDCLAIFFEDEQHDVVLASNGEEALHVARTTALDLIVLDLMMPLANGGEVVRALRSANVATPILLASADPALRAKARELQVQGHIAKPYDFDALLAKVEACLGAGTGA